MTHMLSSLAGGKLVVALEVSFRFIVINCVAHIRVAGRLLSGRHCQLSVGSNANNPGRHASATIAHDRI